MIDTNELRRLAQAAPLPQTDYVLGLEGDGYTSDHLLTEPGYSEDQMRDYVSQTIHELLDRLEAAEKERDDVAQQLVQSEQGKRKISEECDALRAKVEAVESDAAHQKALAESALRVAEGWERKCDALRAKIAEMEKQEPVATKLETPQFQSFRVSKEDADTLTALPVGTKLYALPGAQPAPSEEARLVSHCPDGNTCTLNINGVEMYYDRIDRDATPAPDGWKLVPIEPTPEMVDAAEYVDWGDADVRGSCINAWDRMLAAAPKPEAKP